MFARTLPRCLRSPVARRMLSSNIDKSEAAPSFKTIFLVGIVGTAIFVKAVESLEQNKPKTTFTPSEFDTVMSGLRRRVAIFGQEDLDLHCIRSGTPLKKLNMSKEAKIIRPSEVAEFYRNKSDDKYYALLNEVYDKEGESYLKHLPKGLNVEIIGRYMRENCKKGDTVYLLDFPENIKDAIKFENEVSVIDRVVVPKSSVNDEVSQYFKTVNKVDTI